jgi:hypothetical protein
MVEGVVLENMVAGAKESPFTMRGLAGATIQVLVMGLYCTWQSRIRQETACELVTLLCALCSDQCHPLHRFASPSQPLQRLSPQLSSSTTILCPTQSSLHVIPTLNHPALQKGSAKHHTLCMTSSSPAGPFPPPQPRDSPLPGWRASPPCARGSQSSRA